LEALVARLTEDNDNLRRAIRDSEAGAVEARALASQSAAERDAAIAEKLTTGGVMEEGGVLFIFIYFYFSLSVSFLFFLAFSPHSFF
jgi:hypothetical protein